MTNSTNFLIAKFGKKEHLLQLQNGEIFFNSIQTYREDDTAYRGDIMEGRIPINPETIKIYDKEGMDIFETFPRPDKAYQGLLSDEKIMMFCASAITTEIVKNPNNSIWKLKEDFKKDISGFGDHVMLLWSIELLEHIEAATDEFGQKIGFDSGCVLYRNLDDYKNTDEYRRTGSPLDPYFVKGLSYKNQNEWRAIIYGEKKTLISNCNNGFLLKTYPFKFSRIMKATEFLDGTIEVGNGNM